jgi:hypothetical protein
VKYSASSQMSQKNEMEQEKEEEGKKSVTITQG